MQSLTLRRKKKKEKSRVQKLNKAQTHKFFLSVIRWEKKGTGKGKGEGGGGGYKGNGGKREKNMHNWESNHCLSTGKEGRKKSKGRKKRKEIKTLTFHWKEVEKWEEKKDGKDRRKKSLKK